jgi:hypothetical protein
MVKAMVTEMLPAPPAELAMTTHLERLKLMRAGE